MISWITILYYNQSFYFSKNDQKVVCDNGVTDKELFDSLKCIPNNKSAGNGGLTKEFYETFWDKLKDSFINSIKLAYQKRH